MQVPQWQAALVGAAVALRTWLLRRPYGDQALFVHRRTLEELEVCLHAATRACSIAFPKPSPPVLLLRGCMSPVVPACRVLQGFAGLAVLEDVEFVSRLNACCRPVLVPAAAATSGRRYSALGFWANVAANNALMLGWALGVEPRLLGRAYQALGQRRQQRR